MKKIALAFTFLAALPLAVAAQVSKEDLKKLAAAGISDDVILSYVRANGGVARLSAEDVIELKQAGASEKLLSSVLGSGAAAAPSAPAAPQRSTVTTDQYMPPSSSYVYDSSPYYYTPSVSYAVGIGAYFGGYYPYYYGCYPRYYGYGYCYPHSYYGYGYCSPHYSTPYYRGSAGVSAYRGHR
jgi:hypothetical protein